MHNLVCSLLTLHLHWHVPVFHSSSAAQPSLEIALKHLTPQDTRYIVIPRLISPTSPCNSSYRCTDAQHSHLSQPCITFHHTHERKRKQGLLRMLERLWQQRLRLNARAFSCTFALAGSLSLARLQLLGNHACVVQQGDWPALA